MNAQEAKELTAKSINMEVFPSLLQHVYAKIAVAAKTGKHEIYHPLDGVKNYPSGDAQEALWAALIADGYKVNHHPDPDPGHPCSRPYTTVSW